MHKILPNFTLFFAKLEKSSRNGEILPHLVTPIRAVTILHFPGFETGGYKCECKQGYEYPFEDPITYFDGQLLEAEFISMVKDRETRFDMLKCRLASATKHGLDLITVLVSIFVLVFGVPMIRRR